MDWQKTLQAIAPTVATAIAGPLGGAAVAAIGGILGLDNPTQASIEKIITNGQLTSDQLGRLKELELQYQNDEKERGFKYADLAFQDRDSARKNNVAGGTQKPLFWLSLLLLGGTLGTEGYVLFHGLPTSVTDMVAGRVLGLMDAVALMVLTYWYGTSSGSAMKTNLLAQQTKDN